MYKIVPQIAFMNREKLCGLLTEANDIIKEDHFRRSMAIYDRVDHKMRAYGVERGTHLRK